MARENFFQFLVGLSSDPKLYESFKSDPQVVMEAAALTAEEQALVTAGNEKAIRTFLGDDLGPTAQIKIDGF